eukprot:55499-Alexandrium_andersonii.AAC.1
MPLVLHPVLVGRQLLLHLFQAVVAAVLRDVAQHGDCALDDDESFTNAVQHPGRAHGATGDATRQ